MGWGLGRALGVPGVNARCSRPARSSRHFVSMAVGHDATVTEVLALALPVAHGDRRGLPDLARPEIGTVRACGLALALVVALGPIVLPWYALWALVILAAGGNTSERGYAVLASLAFLIVLEPSGSAMPDLMLMIILVVLAAAAFRGRIRTDAALDRARARGVDRGVSNLRHDELTSTALRSALPLEPQSICRRWSSDPS